MDDTISKLAKKHRVFIESPEGAGYFYVFLAFQAYTERRFIRKKSMIPRGFYSFGSLESLFVS